MEEKKTKKNKKALKIILIIFGIYVLLMGIIFGVASHYMNKINRFGEIDIIVEKSGCISFIEVKTRASNRFGRPIEAVTPAKQRKIHRCAEYYLQCRGLLEQPPVLSFDVVEIIIESTAAISIRHLPHCF